MKSRNSFFIKLMKFIQRAPLWPFRIIEWPFIKLYGNKNNFAKAIFILGLPRSGTTVTYQTICHGLNVSYLSNIWHLLYQVPLLGGYISYFGAKNHFSNFKSKHGFVHGVFGPAEGMTFWKYWLDCGLTDSDCNSASSDLISKRSKYLNIVLAIIGKKNKPFASAYLGHVLVPDRLNQLFPGSVFIRLKRDPIYNALSILNSMKDTKSEWFSLLPRECENNNNLSIHQKVASQVYWLNRRLDASYCSKSMITINYEDLCKNPNYELGRIRKKCLQLGFNVEYKFKLPGSFPIKNIDEKNNFDFVKITEEFLKLEENFGKLE